LEWPFVEDGEERLQRTRVPAGAGTQAADECGESKDEDRATDVPQRAQPWPLVIARLHITSIVIEESLRHAGFIPLEQVSPASASVA
jgi:hypothetical protein